MVATRGRTFKRPWRRSCHSSKLKSSSAPIGRKDSWCFHGVGSSNAPLLGSTAAEGLQRIGRTSIATRWRFCGLPQSASCSENFVIPPDVFGQTLRSKLSAIVCATILAATVSAPAKDDETRTCKTTFGGQVVCGNLTIGITLEQYEAGLKKRAEEIRGEEAEKRVQLQKLMELTERATSAEKESLRGQIGAVEAEKRKLEAESKGVADRLTNLQASYDGLVQKLAEANAALEAFAPLVSKDAFAQAQAMLSNGDVLGAERKFVEIADTVRKIREQADVVEARAIFEAGKLAEERIDWRAANAHYARAARLQPSNWQYAQRAG